MTDGMKVDNADKSHHIASYTKDLVTKYARLQDGDRSIPFWDLVVLACSCDPVVETAFKLAIKQHALPPSAEYLVLPDPPGPKVECGGATLHIIQTLETRYGDKLDSLRVIIIHAGGFSKRLIHHAVLGKIFSPLPVGDRGITMLDLKLTMYLPYVNLLPHGILVTGCDDIQLAWLPADIEGVQRQLAEAKQDFVALAHPAPISTAVNHGVYVLPSSEKLEGQYVHVSPCEEVLQKPPGQLIRERGAVYGSDGTDELVHIDGAFWLGGDARRRLSRLYSEVRPITEELSAYRDFLPCMGRRADRHYFTSVIRHLPEDSLFRRVYRALSDTQLLVLALPKSRFFHLGTLSEYLLHLDATAGRSPLARHLPLTRHTRSSCPATLGGLVMFSVVSAQAEVPDGALLEFSRVEGEVRCRPGTLLSGCHVIGPAFLPGDCVLHTAAVRDREGRLLYVTLAVGLRDDVKSAARLLGRPVRGAGEHEALWNLRVFPCADTMAESAAATLGLLTSPDGLSVNASHRWSMDDVMKHRDPVTMLNFRQQLLAEIDATRK